MTATPVQTTLEERVLEWTNTLDKMVYAEVKVFMPLLTERLVKFTNQHHGKHQQSM